MRSDPIVIFGSPRGGTSLVAGCFVNFGFWVGKTYGGTMGIGCDGYVNYENDAIKQFCKKHWPLRAGKLMHDPGKANMVAFCRKIIPPDQLWLFKGPTEYYPIFAHHFPNMTPVFVFRKESQAIEAVVRRRGEPYREGAIPIIQSRYKIQEELLERLPYAFRVDADKVVEGDYSQVEQVLHAYGIDLDPVVCGRHLQPQQWHV